MCLQCVAEAELVLQEVIPGYQFYVSQKENEEWPKGYYGVIVRNDPDFIFPCDFSKSEEKHSELPKGAFEAENWFYMDPYRGHRFVEACKQAGYDKEEDGWNVSLWFLKRVHGMLKEERPNEDVRLKEF